MSADRACDAAALLASRYTRWKPSDVSQRLTDLSVTDAADAASPTDPEATKATMARCWAGVRSTGRTLEDGDGRWAVTVPLRDSTCGPLPSRPARGRTVQFGAPKTAKSKRVVPIARAVTREIVEHLDQYVGADADALLFTSPGGGPLWRASFARDVWGPAIRAAGLPGLRIHDLRHSFVAIMIDAGANPKEVSVWAGHSSVAFTLDRYGHLYDDHGEDVVDRIDAMLSMPRAKNADIQAIG